MLTRIKTAFLGTAVVISAAIAAPAAYAVQDYSTLTTAVDWTATGTALLAVGAAVIAIFVVMKGIKLIVKMVKGA